MADMPFDQIGYWSEIKLEIVRKYAAAYSKILTAKRFIRRHIYIDAFAGWGIHLSKSTGEFVLGSPINSLNVDPPFAEYHFIDLDGQRVENLQKISAERNDVHLHQGDCNEILVNSVFPRCMYDDYARALCLLDPYSINVDWNVLQTAGKMGSVEIFYNFMIMDANMNVFWRNPDKVRQSQIERMNSSWGDESWRSIVYQRQKDLFGEFDEKVPNANSHVIAAFRKRLQTVAGFKYVPEPIPMKNRSGAVVYYLFFASPDETGGRIVSEIFDKYRDI